MLTATQIARELRSPTKTWHVTHLGGSRASGKQSAMCTNTGLAWGGAAPPVVLPVNSDGHASTWAAVAGNAATDNPAIAGETVNAWATKTFHTVVFTGEAEPDSVASQLCYGQLYLPSYPLLRARLIANGGGAKARCVYRKHATGLVGGDGVRLEFVENTAPQTVIASSVITDTTGTGLAVAEVVIPPGIDWATRGDVYLRWRAVPGGSNPAGAILQWTDLWLESDGPCLVHHDRGISGGHWGWWLNDDFAPQAQWDDLNGAFGPDQILWSASGVNSWGNTVEENAVNLAGVIARFRSTFPDGPIVLDTQYPSHYTAGVPATWREAIFQVAAVTDGCLVIDPYGRRDFEAWFSAGWIDDGIHANPDGVAAWLTYDGEIIDGIAGDDSTMTHNDALRTAFATAVLAAIDGGDAAGKIVLRDGETVVATVTLGDPSGTVSGPTLSFAGFPRSDLACDDAGTPDNALVTDSDDAVVLTLTAGVADAEVLLAKATYAAGEPLKINSATYTAPV